MEKVYIPQILEGPGVLSLVGTKALELKASKVLIMTDSFLKNTDSFHKITASLDAAGLSWEAYSHVRPNPRAADCDLAASYALKNSVDLFIGFGGGSTLDQAKAAAALAANGKKCTDWDNVPLDVPMIPTICIPTTSGTGSEVTFVAVITDESREYKMSISDPEKLLPACAICDPSVTITLPPSLTASCGIDALTHAIEAYTSKASSVVTDALALQAIRLISKNILTAYHHGENISARENMMIGSTLAGIAFINSNVGAVHALAETIGAKYDVPHGVANSLFLPYVMEFNYPAACKKYADIAASMGIDDGNASCETLARKCISYVKHLCEDMHIPTLKQLKNISPDDFNLIAERSASNPLSLDNAREIHSLDYLKILYRAYNNN